MTKARHIIISLVLTLVVPSLVKGQDAMFSIQLDNDIFNLVNQTDRYYTNGVHIGVYHPTLNKSFINHLLIGGSSFALQTTGLTLYQGIYTPRDIYTDQLQSSDRPYASTLLLGQQRVVVSPQNQIRIKSSIGIGVIGRSAGGEFIQNFIHGLTPHSENANGWQHQISNDLLLDYAIEIEKGWIYKRWLNVSTSFHGQAGTYKNLFGVSGRMNIGLLDHRYTTVLGYDLEKSNFSVNLFLGGRMHYLFYDATLEGGIFSNRSSYAIEESQVNRRRYETNMGLQIRFKKVVLETGRVWQNQEFTAGSDHAWGYISVGIIF